MRGFLRLTAAVLVSIGLGVGVDSALRPSSESRIAAVPEHAIGDYVRAHGHSYVGDCSKTDVPADVGKYCSTLEEDHGVDRSYLVAPVASEGDVFIVARGHSGWSVRSVSATPPLVPWA